MRERWAERIRAGAAGLGVPVSEGEALVLARHMAEVLAWNRAVDLTGLEGEEEVIEKLFVDSLACWLGGWLRGAGEAVDVGSGAGFPGVVLAATAGSQGVGLRVTLVEAAARKAEFLRRAARAVGLGDVRVVEGRAEEMARRGEYRERFGGGVSRGVARLATLAEYVLPLVRVGGVFLAMKGRGAVEEAREAETAIRLLGGETAEVLWYRLPWCGERRAVVVVRKVRATEARYPRRPGIAAKRPLGVRGGAACGA